MRRKSIGHSATPDTGIAGSEYVNIRIADNDGLFRCAAAFFPEGIHAQWVRFFSRKAVPPINLEEKIAQAERGNDLPRWVHWLVAEYCQPASRSVAVR